MKRNENLKTLSWEHHDGLVLSFRVQQGLKNESNPKDMIDYILYSWDAFLQSHFQKEEQVFEPILKKSKETVALFLQMLEEHEQIRQLTNNLRNDYSDKNHIYKFADLLNKHIRFEERQLFPALVKEVSKDTMIKMGKFLKQNHTHSCIVWQNQFWKN